MGFTIADQYYIKAYDKYPFNLTESVENLNYALSYNNNHAQANCLMGRLYSEYINDPERAGMYFEQALTQDLANLDIIRYYTYFLIKQKEFEKANKIILYAKGIKGVNNTVIFRFESLIAENQKQFKKAKKLLKAAITEACNLYDTDFLKSELSRVKDKIKAGKSKSKKKVKKKKKKNNKS